MYVPGTRVRAGLGVSCTPNGVFSPYPKFPLDGLVMLSQFPPVALAATPRKGKLAPSLVTFISLKPGLGAANALLNVTGVGGANRFVPTTTATGIVWRSVPLVTTTWPLN